MAVEFSSIAFFSLRIRKEKLLKFNELSLSAEILKAVEEMGFEEASPIQAQSIPPLLKGKDLIGQAQTGTGKTASFGIPMIEIVEPENYVQGLVLCPTRELTIQVANEITKLAKYKRGIHVVPIYGGTNFDRQRVALKNEAQIVVGTPGRIMDHLRRRTLKLGDLKIAVLDEADEMFDMGFRDDMKTIFDQTNREKQTCFFSATMGKEITEFSKIYQNDPEVIKVKHKELTVENITQYYLEMSEVMKTEILSRIVDIYNPKLSIVFCNTKRKVDKLVEELSSRGYRADGLHGDLKQNQRDHVMKKFRQSNIEILVATDVAARGIDVGNVDVVINFDIPQDEEYYVHRIGRTARAGRKGKAFSFVVGRDIYKLQDIMRYTKAQMEYMELPTISDMDARQFDRLIEIVEEKMERKPDISKYLPIIDGLLAREYGAVEIAALLLKMVDEQENQRNHQRLDQVDYGKKYKWSGKGGSKKGKGSSNYSRNNKNRNKNNKKSNNYKDFKKGKNKRYSN